MKKLITKRLFAIIFVFLCATTIFNSCKKDDSLSTADEKTLVKLKSKTLLTKNAVNLSSRLDVIKSEFYKRKLDAKFAPKKEGDIIWTPQWSDPKIQTVNDSVSYVFYHLKPEAKRDGKMIDVKEIGAVSYIMVKNETEFYEAFFYLPANLRSKTPNKDTPETFMGKFTGKLLLTNLENKQNFLLDYKDGSVSDAYKKKMLESRKQLAVKGTTAYTQEICTTVTLGCSFTTDGFDGCWEEGIRVEYRTDCMYPSSCGNWRLTDIRTQTICETFWFPDPPVDPNDPGGTGSPPIDCAGVYFGTAYMSDNCGCIGGTTGITECSKNPCEESKALDYKYQRESSSYNSLASQPSSVEYGMEIRLTSIPGNDYLSPYIRTTATNSFTPEFTWNSSQGFTVGFAHKHTNGTGPSPADVMTPFEFGYRAVLLNNLTWSNYYRDNMNVITMSGSNIYNITIADWAAVRTIYDNNTANQLKTNYQQYANDYLSINSNASISERTEYALMQIFGSSINFYKQNSTTGKFEAYNLDANGNVQKINCP